MKPTDYKTLINKLADGGSIELIQNDFEICLDEFLNDPEYYENGIKVIKDMYSIELADGEDFKYCLEHDLIYEFDDVLYSDRKIEEIVNILDKFDTVLRDVDDENYPELGSMYSVSFELDYTNPLKSKVIVKDKKPVFEDDDGEINGDVGTLIAYIDEYIECPIESLGITMSELEYIEPSEIVDLGNKLWSSYSSYKDVVYSDEEIYL